MYVHMYMYVNYTHTHTHTHIHTHTHTYVFVCVCVHAYMINSVLSGIQITKTLKFLELGCCASCTAIEKTLIQKYHVSGKNTKI